jgi:hypothetical protein
LINNAVKKPKVRKIVLKKEIPPKINGIMLTAILIGKVLL